ncbi:MAG: AAA family ATPase [Chloroflexi bacterium]|nr:AAA family ATPase [Chloroflexota bacterium]
MDLSRYEVPLEKLRWQCDPAVFDFDCTRDLAPLREFIGQERAIRAIQFGLNMDHDGYNIYVAGLTGTGKTSIVKTYIERLVEKRRIGDGNFHPDDWLYVHNFTDADRPKALKMPQGKGKVFRDEIGDLLGRLKDGLTSAFSSEEYKADRKKTVEAAQEQQQKLFEEMAQEARRRGLLLEMTAVGPALIPVVNGKPVSQTDYMALDERTRRELEGTRAEVLKKLQATLEKVQELQRQTIEKLENTDKAVADITVSRLFASLMKTYGQMPEVVQFLNALKEYTVSNLDIFKEVQEKMPTVFGLPASQLAHGRDPFVPFQVNVFVDNSETQGPPVITEPNPIYGNLFGKIERRFLFGGYLSDHTMLKPGAIHLANGGYLLLSVNEVLANQVVWPALKRSVKTKEARIEDPFEQFGLIAPQGLRPEPIPIEVKVVLIGDPMIYQLLSMYDEEFWEIFRVKADFDYQIEKTGDNMKQFAAFVAGCCEECQLRHFDRTGVARVLEFASRMVADQQKLSSRFSQIRELVQEAEYWTRQEGAPLVTGQHVERAVEERRFRHNLPDERIQEMITRGVIIIDTDGAVEGQVNGLSVLSLGDITFGKPSRITCKTFLGRHGIINIERESQLSGRIHDKGVLILSGYMGWKYAQDIPLSLSASLCFEQSYEGVEGDSASSTELYALLSSLSGTPIKQGIAVTGSVNQKGEIQPIGGVNQKIEGFFQCCKAVGLTGAQGVMIPRRNLDNLMLRQEVADAVRAGSFRIYAVSTIDEGLAVLTGAEVGQRQANGAYPENTINYRVDQTLRSMASKLKQFAVPFEEVAASDGKVKAGTQ